MTNRKFMVLMRSQSSPTAKSGGARPSPEQMQQMFAAYKAWMDKFKDEILDVGDKLKPGGKLVSSTGVADGPSPEAKELIGGYMIIAAPSLERAVEVVQACPASQMPGGVMEVRELSGAKM